MRMAGISYNVWLRGLCAGLSWCRPLCFPLKKQYILHKPGVIQCTGISALRLHTLQLSYISFVMSYRVIVLYLLQGVIFYASSYVTPLFIFLVTSELFRFLKQKYVFSVGSMYGQKIRRTLATCFQY
jgi:hypothetical protein